MPTAPVLRIDAFPDLGLIQVGYRNPDTSGDFNRLWRMCPSEYGGQWVKIADPVGWYYSASPVSYNYFFDSNVASDKAYSYYVEAVTAGVTAASLSIQSSISLVSAWLHSAKKNDSFDDGGITRYRNADLVMQLIDFAPYQQSRKLNSSSRIIANSTRPAVSIGNVRHTQLNPSILIPFDNDNRAALRAIFKSPFYACLRTARGEKYFGRLVAPTEQYGATFTTPGLVFEALSFDESVG